MMNEIEKIVEDVVRHQLGESKISSVRVHEEVDHEGDPILRVEIVIDFDASDLDVTRMRGLARHLRDPLAQIGDDLFPVFSVKSLREVAGEAA